MCVCVSVVLLMKLMCWLSWQEFALAKGDEEVINTLQHFAKSVEEVRVCVHVCMHVCVCVQQGVSVRMSGLVL